MFCLTGVKMSGELYSRFVLMWSEYQVSCTHVLSYWDQNLR